MYNKNFWKRAHISQLCKFMLHEAEDLNPEEETFEERYKKYNKAFNAGIYKLRDSILKTDWNLMKDDTERDIKTECMYNDLICAQGNLSDLAFEVGVTVGFQLNQEFEKNKKAVSTDTFKKFTKNM